MLERRSHARLSLCGEARVQYSGVSSRSCILSDVSDGGARLYTEAQLPDRFTLLLGPKLEYARECAVMWRLGHEVGVKFVDVPRQGFAASVTRSKVGFGERGFRTAV